MSEYIGSKVTIPGSRGYGVLRYFGPISGKSGIFGGVELMGPLAAARGKNSGDVNGVQYFEVQHPMSGIFLPYERLKSVNMHLREVRSSSSTPTSRSEISYTPSPKDRSVSSSATSNKLNHTPINTLGPSLSLQLPKRISRRPISIDEKLFGSGSDDEAIQTQNKLRAELEELRSIHEQSRREQANNLIVLNELRATVNEVQPLIEGYEDEIQEKDKKLTKLKDDFYRAREEWRESLDLMVSSQQDTEAYYENEIAELHAQMKRLSQNFDTNNEPLINSNGKHIDDEVIIKLNEEKKQLEILLETAKETKARDIEAYEQQIHHLEQQTQAQLKQIAEFKQDLNSERQLTSSLRDQLEARKDEEVNGSIGSNGSNEVGYTNHASNLDDLVDGVNSLQLNDSNSALRRENERLKEALEKARDAEIELNGSRKALVEAKNVELEVESLKEALKQAMNAEQEVEQLKKALHRANKGDSQVGSLKEALAKTRDMEIEIENLKHELEIRPSFDELTELQSSLDILETLHKTEKEGLINQTERLEREKRELRERLAEVEPDQNSLQLPSPTIRDYTVEGNDRADARDPIRTDLPIYTPDQPVDPSAGRDDWCGLCEREGHNSFNCPYENDIF